VVFICVFNDTQSIKSQFSLSKQYLTPRIRELIVDLIDEYLKHVIASPQNDHASK